MKIQTELKSIKKIQYILNVMLIFVEKQNDFKRKVYSLPEHIERC